MSNFLMSAFLSATFSGALPDLVRNVLQATADKWFHWLLISSALVAVGVALEVWEATVVLKRWVLLKRGKEVSELNEKSWAIPASYLGLLLLIFGVVGEGIFEGLVSNADTALRAHDSQILAQAEKDAGYAKSSSEVAADAAKHATESADEAKGKAGEANGVSEKAKTAASDALTIANSAHQEADSFEKDIVSAKTQAAEAESHLADALQRAAKAEHEADSFEQDIVSAKTQAAEAESHLADALKKSADTQAGLNRLKTPRSLTNASTLTTVLQAFKGTEYTVIGCFQDQESIDLLVQLDKVLAGAGWTRDKSSLGDIELNISKDFAVPITTRSGIFVDVESTETVDTLKATPQPMLPKYIRAAVALRGGLASGINPSQDDLAKPFPVVPGNSTSVFIIVGKKP